MAEYVVKGAEPNETVLHSLTPNGYEAWHWLPVLERIVRCRDCEFYQRNDRCGGALQCLNERFMYGKWGVLVGPDFFCADGKPREVDE